MSILILLIQEVFLIGLLCHLWYFTDFFTLYATLFKKFIPKSIYSFLLIDEFNFRSGEELKMSYSFYLYQKYSFSDNKVLLFFLKLVSCPICFTTWLSLFASIACGNLLYMGVIFFFSRLVDNLLKFFLKQF